MRLGACLQKVGMRNSRVLLIVGLREIDAKVTAGNELNSTSVNWTFDVSVAIVACVAMHPPQNGWKERPL